MAKMNNKTAFMALLLTCSFLSTSPVRAQAIPAPSALVISNSKYATLPALPMCDLSANLVSAVLSRAGFKVTRQNDLSNARLGTAIAALGENAAATPNSRALIYVCSYATTYADRLFLLPVEIRLDRDTDVLTGGIVARLLISSVAGPGSEAGLVLMDVAVAPGQGALDFSTMLRPADAAHGGLMAAGLQASAALGPAPLASALSETIGSGNLEIGALLTSLSANPALRRSILIDRPPNTPSWLLGGPAPPSPAPSPAEPAVSAAAPATPASPPPVAVSPPPTGSALADPNPAERRRLQLALSHLGYYRGRIDGVFALDTALAIRQFQRDSNAEPTGKLTTPQMDQLLR